MSKKQINRHIMQRERMKIGVQRAAQQDMRALHTARHDIRQQRLLHLTDVFPEGLWFDEPSVYLMTHPYMDVSGPEPEPEPPREITPTSRRVRVV